jgi:hypothetical protein
MTRKLNKFEVKNGDVKSCRVKIDLELDYTTLQFLIAFCESDEKKLPEITQKSV